MMVIGFGKQVGASNAHRAAAHAGYEPVLRAFAKTILGSVPIFGAVALLEDQHHQTATVEVIRPENIIDRMGKDISGSGMDTNVIGRDISGYLSSLHPDGSITPRVSRIFVRELTPASNGNGVGIGLADFTTARLVKSLNLEYTYMNALTSLGLVPAKIPIHFETDREAIHAALASLAATDPGNVRVVRIADTLNLERFQASEPCIGMLNSHQGVKTAGTAREMDFDTVGNLLPL